MVLAVCLLLAALSSSTTATPPPRLIPAPTFEEPYLPLNGGTFSGPPIPFHADPLATYVWPPTVNASILQTYALAPVVVTLTPDTAAAAFSNVDSLLGDSANVTVSGPGGIQLDFGINSAAWIEFESDDLTVADAGKVQLSVSEYDEYEITNLGDKTGAPTRHTRSDGATMWRLELAHPDLYEGVRFAWLRMNSTPSAPWHITAARLVCQIKPTNYGGAFAAAGDDDLSRIWYLGAYTVKVNLLSDQFGSILIYRGDRFSWTGDAHVSQATGMAALGNFDFVKQNLLFTQNNCNGIESYCLYFVLSVTDYFAATNDTAAVAELTPPVVSKLEHAHTVWGTQISLGFYGWDDRLGSGFVDSKTSAEAQAAYRSLAIRSWRAWAGVCAAVGNSSGAAHWNAYADAATSATRAPGSPAWYAPLGLYASADAINAGVPTAAETSDIVSRLFNDSVTVCALSPFNTFFALGALALAGEFDRGLATIHTCWDVMIRLGATTAWEIAKPDWDKLFSPYNVIGQFQGFTSMAHPWSSGATAWLTAHIAGVRPTSPGFATFVVAPHVAGNMSGVSATVPLPGGESIMLQTLRSHADAEGSVCVAAPSSPRVGTLQVSELLAARLTGASGTMTSRVFFSPGAACDCGAQRSGEEQIAAPAPLDWSSAMGGPVDPATGSRVRVAAFSLRAGGCTRVALRGAVNDEGATQTGVAAPPNPFPPPFYPATFIGRDEVTSGTWLGAYGSEGYYLVAFDGADQHVTKLPSWVASVAPSTDRPENGPWLNPPPANNTVALQDPRSPAGPRKIGQYCASNQVPTMSFDITTTADAPAGTTYQYAFYFADYDSRGRRQTVQLMDLETLADVSPTQLVGPDFTEGVWLVWQYPRAVRIRVNLVRGTNNVLSAVAFDSVATELH